MSIYLNNGATSWPKPPVVAKAVYDFMTGAGANLGRGAASNRDLRTASMVLDCRVALARLFGGWSDRLPTLVTFTASVTESLNLVLRGLLRPGDRVVTTSMEHNAVIRPLHDLSASGVEVRVVPCSTLGELDPDDWAEALGEKPTRLAVLSHASNICGTVQNLNTLAAICRDQAVDLIVDAAQTAGHLPIDTRALGLAALCFTGHKGLLGPQGTGGVVWRPDVAAICRPLLTGGTGSFSDREAQPEVMPDRFESGTPNLPGLAGLKAAIEWIESTGMDRLEARTKAVSARLLDGLMSMDGCHLSGRTDMTNRLPVFLINFNGLDNGLVAAGLSDRGVETRSGLHCSPWGHRTLGTFPQGGLRLSPGPFTTDEEIDRALELLAETVREVRR